MLVHVDKIDQLLARGVKNIYPSKEELEKILRSSKKLRVYQGFDPSSPQLHIGHLIGLRKLKQWQDLDHEVIFLIGDFTGRIGDPTGKEETRPLLSKETVEKNTKSYREQAEKIIKFDGKNPAKIKFNSEWLEKLPMQEVFNLAAQVTYQQIIKRDLYKRRIEKNKDLSMNEVMYPLMQGYDSVAMDVDVEIGGEDQLFNMMMGRHLMHKMKRKNKFVMTTQLLTDAQGNKIGKTEDNVIAITDSPEKIFGAIMNFPDEAIIDSLKFLTDIELEKIESIRKTIKAGKNPIDFKKLLAFEVVKQVAGRKKAKKAQVNFEIIFQKGQKTKNVPEIKVNKSKWKVVDFLVEYRLLDSKSIAKRLLNERAIEIDGNIVRDKQVEFKNDQVVRIGKKKFVKVTLAA